MVSDAEFCANSEYCGTRDRTTQRRHSRKRLRSTNAAGNVPVKSFISASNHSKFFNVRMAPGNVPANRLPSMNRVPSSGLSPNATGRVPFRKFQPSSSARSWDHWPRLAGSVPKR